MSHMKINDLVEAAYATAPTLPPAATELMRSLATRLDITFVALKEAMDQRTAVIAEVSGVITACEHVYAAGYQAGHLNTVDDIAYKDGTREEFAGLAVEVLTSHMETPAFDKFRDELRAQGVEMFAENEMEWAAHWEKYGIKDGSKSRCVMVAQDAEKFAAQLRQKQIPTSSNS